MNMNYKIRNIIITSVSILILIVILNGCIQGTPEITLLIENQSNDILTIYIDNALIGKVNPTEIIRHISSLATDKWLIQAKNAQGEIVFSKKFAFEELQKVSTGVYKAIIPPLSNSTTSSENTTISDNVSGVKN